MVSVSVCMIVKNEEKILSRCLDSLAGLYDELVIVDTGSTDSTKEIASKYTDKVYDFTWVNDFAKARNYAFSLCSCDYIYSADADEVLDEENYRKFSTLIKHLDDDIEIVQMKYSNQLSNSTVYNFDEEYRPKLFKRVRNFTWIHPIHENVRLNPVVFDSDIVIGHYPLSLHTKRDIEIFKKHLDATFASKHLRHMFVQELFLSGDDEDFITVGKLFDDFLNSEKVMGGEISLSEEDYLECSIVVLRAARILHNEGSFLKYAIKCTAEKTCSEALCEIASKYEESGEYSEAALMYYNAAYEDAPLVALKCGTTIPLNGLVRCYEAMGLTEEADKYRAEIK